MIVHLVLFKPRGNLKVDERRALVAAFSEAVTKIPSVRRARVGRRITHGRGYEQLMTVDYSYAAVLEFDDLPGLLAYLADPAHVQLGTRFFESFDQALMYDFDLEEGLAGMDTLLDET